MANYNENDIFNDDELDLDEDSQKDKYITFKISSEEYAIEIRYVTEIIGMQEYTFIPDMPEFIKGVINLRGKVIPIIDIRLRFRMVEIDYNDRTCIIVVTIDDTTMGLIVDHVSEVLDIPSAQVDPAPKASKKAASRYIQGIGKVGEAVKIILDITKLLSDDEFEALNEI